MNSFILSLFLYAALAPGCGSLPEMQPSTTPGSQNGTGGQTGSGDQNGSQSGDKSEDGLSNCGGDHHKELTEIASLSSYKGLVPGDTLYVASGVYNDVKLTFRAEGTAENPIVLKPAATGGVRFTGASSFRLKGSYVVVEGFEWSSLTLQKTDIFTFDSASSNCVLKSCVIDGTDSSDSASGLSASSSVSSSSPSSSSVSNGSSVSSGSSDSASGSVSASASGSAVVTADSPADKWVSLKGRNNTVTGCSFFNKKNMGTLLVVWLEEGIVPRHRITNNLFTRPYTIYGDDGKALNGQETIRIGDSKTSMSDACCVVSDNYFKNCHGERAEIISNKSCGNVYEHNYFHASAGTLTLRHGNACVVRGNYFDAAGVESSGGVRIIGESHIVEDNVIVGSTGSGYNSAICVVKGESDAALNGYWTVKNAVVRRNLIVGCKNGVTVNYGARTSQDSAPVNLSVSDNVIIAEDAKAVTVSEYGTLSDLNVSYSANVIYGGVQKNVHTSLPLVSQKPRYEDWSEECGRIAANAGAKWY